MIILISGATHTGKTYLSQKLLEQLHYPCFSIDHLKMGLIRSGQTSLTPCDDEQLRDYLWPILREMIKTAIENRQNLIIEGDYIPFDWAEDFEPDYCSHICHLCLVMTERYIRTHFDRIRDYGSIIEQRMDDSDLTEEWLIEDNARNYRECVAHGCPMILIDENYDVTEKAGGILCPM